MGAISGLVTTFNSPNYVGELLLAGNADTPFLTAIGGINGAGIINSKIATWQVYAPGSLSTTGKKEGQAAPTASGRSRAEVFNVAQILQEAISVSYSSIAGQNNTASKVLGTNPVQDEVAFQTGVKLIEAANLVENVFINGERVNPSDNNSARQARGILEAIETNVVDASSAALSEKLLLDAMQDCWAASGIRRGATRAILCGGIQKRWLTKIFVTDKGYTNTSALVGGVDCQTILTDFGVVNVMLNPYMPADEIAIVSLEECQPVFVDFPGKGQIFVEPLGKTGASESYQLYGEFTLKYGDEAKHGKIEDLSTDAPGS
jgi:hypothetical protein